MTSRITITADGGLPIHLIFHDNSGLVIDEKWVRPYTEHSLHIWQNFSVSMKEVPEGQYTPDADSGFWVGHPSTENWRDSI